jgi:hypothetical protein
MQPHLQRIEGEAVADRNRQLAVQDEIVGRQRGESGDHLGEIAVQHLAGLGKELDVALLLDSKAPKAVPFGLERPARIGRERIDQQRFHRFDGRRFWRCGRLGHARVTHERPPGGQRI